VSGLSLMAALTHMNWRVDGGLAFMVDRPKSLMAARPFDRVC